jgi:opacity protein-like surface antigen
VGGVSFQPSEPLTLKLDLAWNEAQASFQSFRFTEGEGFAAMRPNQSFDFTQTFMNSDLDTSFIEAGIHARYDVKKDVYVTAGYRYLDFDDSAPYLGDDSGKAEFVNFGVGWAF